MSRKFGGELIVESPIPDNDGLVIGSLGSILMNRQQAFHFKKMREQGETFLLNSK
jgi:hypothetical protein